MKERVLFVCVQNTARSQMAEGILKSIAEDTFEVYSAGITAGSELNPYAVAVMREIGIDISKNRVKSIEDLLKEEDDFEYVITVCDEGKAASCPVFPEAGTQHHWPLDDPGTFTGTEEERLARTRVVREALRERIFEFLKQYA
ncbi:MAG TPA: arsenate reductase ArsC [Synergistaceae bacterium]|nr:arsenate reductase ArsC [Synergistaceae bacterium]HPJ26039.1 arsenate reductase ArsC [Synergistaceae bacterium]HPQ38011.1 arsenate reductase ArsC [Synergistaceae bacterium]